MTANLTEQLAALSEAELLPCPFCGSRNLHVHDSVSSYVECNDCHAEGPWNDGSLVEALAAWNTRANQIAVTGPDAVERVARALCEQAILSQYQIGADPVDLAPFRAVEVDHMWPDWTDAATAALAAFTGRV